MTLMNVTLMTGFRDWKMTLNDIDWTHSMTFGPVSSSCKRYIAFCHDALNEIHMHVIWTKTHRKELQTKLRETS